MEQEKNSHLPQTSSDWYVQALEKLVCISQELSHARDINSVMNIVRLAARDLTGADGATLILRDGDECHYAYENAISPLWLGRRFAMNECISGWVMMNAKTAVIRDIYTDPRIPASAYKPTFVKSLAMVPIRTNNPVGAIGNYWARSYSPKQEEITILEGLANITSIAIENAKLHEQLAEKVKALESSNFELSCFAWIATHDMRGPLRAISQMSLWIEDQPGNVLQEESKNHLKYMRQRAARIEKLIDDFLAANQNVKTTVPQNRMIDGRTLLKDIHDLVEVPPEFSLVFNEGFYSTRVPHVPLQQILSNLIDNAIRHHDQRKGTIQVNAEETGSEYVFSISDDGPGISQTRLNIIAETLRRGDIPDKSVQSEGLGLALVGKILALYGGKISIESVLPRGTTCKFIWPKQTIPIDLVGSSAA